MSRWPIALIWCGLWLVAPLALGRMLWAIATNPSRAWAIALAFDGLGNVAANGNLGQTISARAASARPKAWACVLCRLLDKIDPGHCERAMNDPVQNMEQK